MENNQIIEEVAIDKINDYAVGAYRFWLQGSGSLALKLDGGKALYTIPKYSKLYDRLKADLFEATKETDNDYALGYYRFWLSVSRQLALKLNEENELYLIPKQSKIYDKLMTDLFPDKRTPVSLERMYNIGND